MRCLRSTLLVSTFILGLLCLTVAEEKDQASHEGKDSREKRSMPNWSLTSSDFFGWVENLRAHAGYDKMEDLARIFWAHFPSASRLGYETTEPEE